MKDKQIKSLGNKIDGLIERNRETNKVLMLEDKSKSETRGDREDKTRQDSGQKIKGFFKRLFDW